MLLSQPQAGIPESAWRSESVRVDCHSVSHSVLRVRPGIATEPIASSRRDVEGWVNPS